MWNTPPELIVRVRAAIGDIDLDPASNLLAQTLIGAADWYGPEQNDPDKRDGLVREWSGGAVFINPPSGRSGNKSVAGIWFEKAEAELEAGRIERFAFLTHSRYGYPWFADRVRLYWTVTTDRCPHFLNVEGKRESGSKTAATFFFAGDFDPGAVRQAFESVGRLTPPDRVLKKYYPAI